MAYPLFIFNFQLSIFNLVTTGTARGSSPAGAACGIG